MTTSVKASLGGETGNQIHVGDAIDSQLGSVAWSAFHPQRVERIHYKIYILLQSFLILMYAGFSIQELATKLVDETRVLVTQREERRFANLI